MPRFSKQQLEIIQMSLADKLEESVCLLEAFGLSMRTQNHLEKSNILTIKDLLNKTKYELLAIEGLGEETLKSILRALDRAGFTNWR